MNRRFEWDPIKASLVLKSYEVSFEEASTVFDDPLFITFLDVEHSLDEERYITLGLSRESRLLLIAHTDRERERSGLSAPERSRQMSDNSMALPIGSSTLVEPTRFAR